MKEVRIRCSHEEEWTEGYFLTMEQLKQLIIDFGETYEPVPSSYNLQEFLEKHLEKLDSWGEVDKQ